MHRSDPPLSHSWMSSDRPVPRLLARPIRNFLSTEASGGIVLLVATVAALAWANSPWFESYEQLWSTDLTLRVGDLHLSDDLRHWVNDGLMTLFFFVVGLEIKREIAVGEMSEGRKAMLPVLAALGGMVVPAAIYVALNAGAPGEAGWGIPMATDIAFVAGVLALLGDRVPSGLKVFLLSLAIVDDIGAILVIAIFYSGGIHLGWASAAAALLVLVGGLRRLQVFWVPVYVVIGLAIWVATRESGVHATIAGVLLGLLTPAHATDPRGFDDVFAKSSELSREPDAQSLRAIVMQGNEVVSVAERLEHLLHPWTSFVVVPLFALANAGLRFGEGLAGDALGSRVALGVALGLLVGKTAGIAGATWIGVRSGAGLLPDSVGWRHVGGGAALAGIGFTVSLFIAGLAFTGPSLVTQAKLGIFAGSLLAGVVGTALLVRAAPPATGVGAEGQSGFSRSPVRSRA